MLETIRERAFGEVGGTLEIALLRKVEDGSQYLQIGVEVAGHDGPAVYSMAKRCTPRGRRQAGG